MKSKVVLKKPKTLDALAQADLELAAAETRFIREAKKYVVYVRRKVKCGDYDADNPVDKPFFTAYEKLLEAETAEKIFRRTNRYVRRT